MSITVKLENENSTFTRFLQIVRQIKYYSDIIITIVGREKHCGNYFFYESINNPSSRKQISSFFFFACKKRVPIGLKTSCQYEFAGDGRRQQRK